MSVLTPLARNGAPIPIFYLTTLTQNVTANSSGGTVNSSSAFSSNTEAVLISVSQPGLGVRISMGASPVASSTSTLLPAPGAYFFACDKSDKLSVISTDANSGTVCVTELASIISFANAGGVS